ncbi:hypothetical protein FB451DRAFT_1083560, partial [Mycena latifolia]
MEAATETLSDNDRLIEVLKICFADLSQKQEEQAIKLHQAVEALQPKAPVTDKKTSFWNVYKTLADEHDREFQQRYSAELDTSLIFAGLFSAVDSAFIIQIQPVTQTPVAPIVLLAQSLLYISLFSTLLAALLAVLGKQWLMYYLAAGERGTIEARGLERQRKFDGLRKWKFDAIMQVFPLLLQIGLFLFSAGLSIYLWTINLTLAIIVLSFTSFGLLSYIVLLISAVVSPDSPFQTPLAILVTRAIPATLWMKLRRFSRPVTKRLRLLVHHVRSPDTRRSRHLLPHSVNYQSARQRNARDLFHYPFPTPSPAVPAVSWVLETSTDPRMLTAGAEMAIDVQWPRTMDPSAQLNRLRESFFACFFVSRAHERH